MNNTTRRFFTGTALALACLGAAHAQTVGPDGITDRKMQFDTTTGVVQSITSTVMTK